MVWWVLGLSLAFGLLPRIGLSVPARVALVSLIVLAAWTALGTLWSSSVGRTLQEATRTLGYAGILLLVARAVGPARVAPGRGCSHGDGGHRLLPRAGEPRYCPV